jgi:TonB family protein
MTVCTTQAANAQNDAFAIYMSNLARRVKLAWHRPPSQMGKSATVAFKVHRNGDLSHLRISKSSGNDLFDESALRAVENAGPFGRFPPDITKEDVDAEITLESKAK